MKKMIAILTVLVVAVTGAAALAEDQAFTFRNGITFQMNMDQVMEKETGRYEIEKEHSRGGTGFWELEYEHTSENNVPADLKYLFVGNELVAIRINYETRDISYAQVKANLTAEFGEAAPVDLALLNNGIYAVDDDGRLERNAEAIVSGNLMIILELDEDDIDVTFVDLNAAYVNIK